MNKSLIILVVSLLATGVDAHETSEPHSTSVVDCDAQCQMDRQEARVMLEQWQQLQLRNQLRRIERRQKWESMQNFMDRAHRK